ncbi:outer membrane protein assembly factor BamE [Candidatus Albibeggiatoa sp. nov. NOAA]|uniref:outer membrane protein assembly factor BamE n=1 Tax=Candidatus Albibeggiatoa sp. nov. NOAA TaxID=3162724 RepID=UPI00330267E8|nr:outer membrane protein assembly factor BamE [Thiotrichaceae bacterium]
MQKFIIVFVFSLLVSNCSLYKIDVQQGNVITQEMLDQLELGMSARKVRFIMGTPLLQDAFHQNRWDYLFSFLEGRSGKRQQQVISLFFDEQQQLIKVSGNVAAGEAKPETSTPTVDPEDTRPIL